MSVLMARDEESHKDQTTKSPLLVQHCSRDKSALRPRDTVRLVNEKTIIDQDEVMFNVLITTHTHTRARARTRTHTHTRTRTRTHAHKQVLVHTLVHACVYV
jgi:hypothetical protein